MRRIFFLLILFFISINIFAQNNQSNTLEPIPVDQAFKFSATARDYQTILARWQIKPGYYLYRARFHFKVIKPKKTQLGDPLLPTGITKSSPDIGSYQVYQKSVDIPIPVISTPSKMLLLQVGYQGCSAKGFCYPPVTKYVPINLSGHYMAFVQGINVDVPTATTKPATTTPKESRVSQILSGKNIWLFILGFLGFGFMISLTPCVLPMIPILSSIIVGQGKITHLRSFGLSLAYVLGMAITYAIAGIIFGLIGGSVQAAFQKPWIIILFSLIFVAMALSLFGYFQLQLPEKWRSGLANISNQQKHGSFIGAALMGVFSTLILSPCVTPPLVGVLGYISKTGNASMGGVALFTMGIGMGVPLLILGAFGPKLLPKAGQWMNVVKNFLGILLLAVAISILERILPGVASMLLWAALAIGTAIYLGAFSSVTGPIKIIGKIIGIIIFVYAVLLIIGAATGSDNPLEPLRAIMASKQTVRTQSLAFQKVKTISDVEKKLALAKQKQQPVMLDFYADWCISCKEMDYLTFSNSRVQKALKGFLLLRANVTANDMEDKTLERYYQVVAPPTMIFFNKDGREIKKARIVGNQSAEKFLQHLKKFHLIES